MKKCENKSETKCCCRKILLRCFLLCLGCFLGVHRKVILAYIKGEELPKAPTWHFWCK